MLAHEVLASIPIGEWLPTKPDGRDRQKPAKSRHRPDVVHEWLEVILLSGSDPHFDFLDNLVNAIPRN